MKQQLRLRLNFSSCGWQALSKDDVESMERTLRLEHRKVVGGEFSRKIMNSVGALFPTLNVAGELFSSQLVLILNIYLR